MNILIISSSPRKEVPKNNLTLCTRKGQDNHLPDNGVSGLKEEVENGKNRELSVSFFLAAWRVIGGAEQLCGQDI